MSDAVSQVGLVLEDETLAVIKGLQDSLKALAEDGDGMIWAIDDVLKLAVKSISSKSTYRMKWEAKMMSKKLEEDKTSEKILGEARVQQHTANEKERDGMDKENRNKRARDLYAQKKKKSYRVGRYGEVLK